MRTSNTEQDGYLPPPGCGKLLHIWEKTWGPLPPRFIDSFATNEYTLLICTGVLIRKWSWETVAYFVDKHKKLKKVAECLYEGGPPQISGTPVPRKPSPSPVNESTSAGLEEEGKSSKVKMKVVITSELDQSFHTWQVLGAKEPRGKIKTSLLPADIEIGDSLDVEAEHGIDGISVTAATRPKEKRNNSVELDLLGSDKEEPLISISLVEQEKSPKRKFKGKLPKSSKGFNPSRKDIARRLDREAAAEEDIKLQRYLKVLEEEKKKRDEEKRKSKKSESVDAAIDEGKTDRIRKSLERRLSSSESLYGWTDSWR